MFGFSLNNLSLFGLVLAIGIVVDDAIVVVENVERNIALGLAPVEATKKAMNEVSGPVIAVALVLCAVFVPTAFVSGITGQFYRQFALTIAVSTVISAFNSLTLSPALSAILLKGHHAKKDWFAAVMDRGARLVLSAVQQRLRPHDERLHPRRGRHGAARRHRAGGLCGAARADVGWFQNRADGFHSARRIPAISSSSRNCPMARAWSAARRSSAAPVKSPAPFPA